jgi:hypothetical protein
MTTTHRIVLLAALAGAGLVLLKRYAALRREREAARALDDRVGLQADRDRASIDDVPVVQPAEPYEPGQEPQPQDLRIAQNVLE